MKQTGGSNQSRRFSPSLRLVTAAVGIGALLFYAINVAPSIVALFDDTLEFQLVGPTFGIAHPTGYPLYILLGGVWSRVILPVGNWAWRMNLLNVVLAAGAVALLAHLALRLLRTERCTPDWPAALAAAAAFALAPIWRDQATVAEVYPLHLLLMAAILAVALGMNRTAAAGADPTGSNSDRLPPTLVQRMGRLCLLIGLGLAHHRTTVLILPGLAVYLLWSVPGLWRPRRVWLLWAAALLLPLLLYLHIPLRSAMGVQDLNGSYQNSWQGFWDHVLARQYTSFFADNPLAVSRNFADWLTLFQEQLGFAALVLAGAGLLYLVDRRGRPARAWILMGLVLASNLLFALFYRVGDVEVFLLPVFFCLALFAGAGVNLTGRLLHRRPRAALALQIGLILVVILGMDRLAPQARRGEWQVHNYAVAMAKVPYPPGSRVIGLEGEMTALRYMQQAQGLGREATPITANDPVDRADVIAAGVEANAPTYITRELPGIEERYSFQGDGPLVRVWPRGEAESPAPQHGRDNTPEWTMLAGQLVFSGYDLTYLDQPGTPALELALYWLPKAPLAQDLKVSLRLVDQEGASIIARDGSPVVVDAAPLRQVAPTSTWVAGEQVRDVHYVPLDVMESPAEASLHVIVYDSVDAREVGRMEIDLHGVWPR